MPQRNFHQWSNGFHRAARDLLARNRHPAAADDFRLAAEPCPEHGPGCVRVTYGCLREHFDLTETDPAAVAADLLHTMLPERAGEEVSP